MLVKGLPPGALVRTPVEERGRDPWTAELELMAQLVELTSVLAAEHRIKKPVKVPRPAKTTAKRVASERVQGRRAIAAPEANPYRAAMAALGGAQPSRKQQHAGGTDSGEQETP